MANKRTPTVARGAVIERSLVQRWAGRAMARTLLVGQRRCGYVDALTDLRVWLQGQSRRTKRPGGIGR